MRFASCALGMLLLLSGCFSQREPGEIYESNIDIDTLQLDVFAARGFLGGSDYERYVLKQDVLWRECGNVVATGAQQQRDRVEGDAVFADDPSLDMVQRRVEEVSSAQRRKIALVAQRLIEEIKQREQRRPPSPGSVFSLSSPGLFELQIAVGTESQRIVTSVDAVADKDGRVLETAHELFAGLRGIGPAICHSQTFFGVARADI